MKNLLLLVVITAIMLTGACKKSDDSEPDITYTIKYEVKSSGTDYHVDTIYYIDKNGVEQLLKNQNNFSETFTSVKNYDAKLDVRGYMNTGNVSYSISVLNGEDIVKHAADSSSTAQGAYYFKWKREFKKTVTK